MNKRFIAFLLLISMSAVMLTGCGSLLKKAIQKMGDRTERDAAGTEGNDPGKEAGQETAGVSVQEGDTADGTGATDTGSGESDSPDTVAFLPDILDYKDRFFYGNRNVYYIGDEGDYTCVLKCEEGESIAGCAGDDEYYFVLVRTENKEGLYDLYFWHGDDPVGITPLYVDADQFVNRIAVLDHCFYYSWYDSEKSDYAHWYYDPRGDAFLEDEKMEDLEASLAKYQGRDMIILGSGSDIPKMLAENDMIFVKDSSDNLIYSFDREGEQLGSFDAVLDVSFNKQCGDYLVGESYDFNEDGRAGNKYIMMYDSRTGDSVELFRCDSRENGPVVLTVEDGYLYYSEENLSEYGDAVSRSIYRESMSDIWDNVRKKQLIRTVNEYPGVESYYGNYGMHEYANMGVSILPDRVYYLEFFPDDSEGYRGDVQWCYVDMNGDNVSDKRVITDCIERHEEFADWGTVETSYDVRRDETDDFIYFKAKSEKFRFHQDVKNAGLMNEEMQELEEKDEEAKDDMSKSAEGDILAGEDSQWYKEQVGFGYSHERTFGNIESVGSHYVQILINFYDYYGGAHGMPYEAYYLFDLDTGRRCEFRDFYKGSEEDFKKTVADAAVKDWKQDKSYKYYESYDPSLEAETRTTFEDNASLDMDIEFTDDGITVYFSPYSVGPFASGFVDVSIPYGDLGFEL